MGELRCSFCNKNQHSVKRLISNPTEHVARAYICDECIGTCNSILQESSDPESPLLFGMETGRLNRMEKMDMITVATIRKVVEADGCALVGFLEQLKRLLEIANTRLAHVERTEIGQQIQKLEQEVRTERKTLEAKKTELEELKEKFAHLSEAEKPPAQK